MFFLLDVDVHLVSMGRLPALKNGLLDSQARFLVSKMSVTHP